MNHLTASNRLSFFFSAVAQRVTGFMIVTSILVACGNSACSLKSGGTGIGTTGAKNDVSNDVSNNVSKATSAVGTPSTELPAIAAKSASLKAAEGAPVQGSPVVAPRVQAKWQEVFAKRGKELDAVEAWGLFSAGGWVDDGQLMIFVASDGRADIEFVPPGGQAVVNRTAIGAAEVQTLRQKLAEIDQLDDHITASYDAVEYELVHLIPVADTGLAIKTRIMMVLPSKEKAPRHDAVLTALKDLRRTRVLK